VAGIPGEVRVVFIPAVALRYQVWTHRATIQHLEPGLTYRAFYFDPIVGDEYDLGMVTGDEQGDWRIPRPPIMRDLILVFERR
jgi:hypothetical protein